MKKASVFLAEGLEECEGLLVVDILRRAGVEVKTVSISSEYLVKGAHNMTIKADCLFNEVDYDKEDMIVLPGGIPGTPNLASHDGLIDLIKTFFDKKKYLAAICAAPEIYAKMGVLKGKRATCHDSREEVLMKNGAIFVAEPVVQDCNIITSRGLGTGIAFGLRLAEVLTDAKTASKIATAIMI